MTGPLPRMGGKTGVGLLMMVPQEISRMGTDKRAEGKWELANPALNQYPFDQSGEVCLSMPGLVTHRRCHLDRAKTCRKTVLPPRTSMLTWLLNLS